MKWDHFLIVYGDLSVVKGQIEEWDDAPKEDVQAVRLCNGRVAQLFMNYDIYALWVEGDTVIVIQAGPQEVYGPSQRVTLPPENRSYVQDFIWDTISEEEREHALRHAKFGSQVSEETYLKAQNIALERGLCH